MIYNAETTPGTAKIKRLMETTKMGMSKRIPLMDRNMNKSIRRACGVNRENEMKILTEWRKEW